MFRITPSILSPCIYRTKVKMNAVLAVHITVIAFEVQTKFHHANQKSRAGNTQLFIITLLKRGSHKIVYPV